MKIKKHQIILSFKSRKISKSNKKEFKCPKDLSMIGLAN